MEKGDEIPVPSVSDMVKESYDNNIEILPSMNKKPRTEEELSRAAKISGTKGLKRIRKNLTEPYVWLYYPKYNPEISDLKVK
jgi:hypothetical protein